MNSTTNESKIDSDKVLIQTVFSEFWFKVPDYQRAYVWGKDEISELFNDINFSCNHSPDGEYFLGSMVLCGTMREQNGMKFREYELLDGQQRLTTLMLVLACIRDRTEDDQLKKTCNEMLFQKANTWKKIPQRNRLEYEIRHEVNVFISSIVEIEGSTLNLDLESSKFKDELSMHNMAASLQVIHDCFNDTDQFPERKNFKKFVEYLLNNVLFIYVATEQLDDAFRLFTILNDRGIPLTNSDILKSKNLGQIDSRSTRAHWATYWERIEGEMGRDEFDRLLSFVRTIYVKDKARGNLLKEFDERIYAATPPLLKRGTNTFDAIKSYQDAYCEAIQFDGLPQGAGNKYQNRIRVMRRALPSTDWIPPVLAWYNKFSIKGLNSFIERIDNKYSADWILMKTPTQRITNMNEILKLIEKCNTPEDIVSKGSFKYEIESLLQLLREDIFGKRFAKYILLRLEFLLFNHEGPLSLPDQISIEHILPQTPRKNSQWVNDFTPEQRELWQHKLGNLMLLSRRKNSSLGNLNFLEKRDRYFRDRVEGLPNSLRLLKYHKFGLNELHSRNDELFELLVASYEI